MRLPDGLAIPALLLQGAAVMLAHPDRTAHMLAGGGWHDQDIPAAWYADRAEAERVARLWAERRAQRNG